MSRAVNAAAWTVVAAGVAAVAATAVITQSQEGELPTGDDVVTVDVVAEHMRFTPDRIEVVAPNLKRRLSGVTATVVRLIPVQARMIGIVATGPGLPPELPHIPLTRAATLPRDRWRVWHARRNTEMALGLILRRVLRRKYRLMFTSAAQRRHTGFTKWLIRQQDALVATSDKAASYLDRPATVVMHGVDTGVFHPAGDRAALRRALDAAFDDARVEGWEQLVPGIDLPDPDDRHVVAAAIQGRADLIVTANLKDFPREVVESFDIEVQSPDEFFMNQLDLDPARVMTALAAQAGATRNPPLTVSDVLERLVPCGAPLFAEAARAQLWRVDVERP